MKKILFILVIGLVCNQASSETKRFTVPVDNSPSWGPQDAAVTIVEFIDYQ